MRISTRAWVEWTLAALLAAAAVATAVWPTWIETLFGVEPDGGSGETEWWIVVVLGVLALVVAALAGRTSIRARSAPPAQEW